MSSGTPGMSTPPRSPCACAQRTSAIAASMSLTNTWAMPARRSGWFAHQSASQRLCARSPAQRSSRSAGLGGRATSAPVGKNGGTVFGNTISATWPSASRSAMRRSSSQLRLRLLPCRSRNGFLYAPRHAS